MKKVVVSLTVIGSLAFAIFSRHRENVAYRTLNFSLYTEAVGLLAINDAIDQNDSEMAKELILISLRTLDSQAILLEKQNLGFGLTSDESWSRLRAVLEKSTPPEKTPSNITEPKRKLMPSSLSDLDQL